MYDPLMYVLYRFMDSKNTFDLESVRSVIEVSMEIVFASKNDASVMVASCSF